MSEKFQQTFKTKKAAIAFLKWDCQIKGNEKLGFTIPIENDIENGEVMPPRIFVIRFNEGFGFYRRFYYVDTQLDAPANGRIKIKPFQAIENKRRKLKLEIVAIER